MTGFQLKKKSEERGVSPLPQSCIQHLATSRCLMMVLILILFGCLLSIRLLEMDLAISSQNLTKPLVNFGAAPHNEANQECHLYDGRGYVLEQPMMPPDGTIIFTVTVYGKIAKFDAHADQFAGQG